jgi:NAD(P)-dependent dehydrogenase (short-subunit alcohol dehydrogenase family)
MGKLKGKVALVTGSARGIGAAIAERLATDGAAVAVNYSKSTNEAEAVAERVRLAGGKAIVLKADVGDWSQATALVEETAKEFGRLDILVNNAAALGLRLSSRLMTRNSRGSFRSASRGRSLQRGLQLPSFRRKGAVSSTSPRSFSFIRSPATRSTRRPKERSMR